MMKAVSFRWLYRLSVLLLLFLTLFIFFKLQHIWLPILFMLLKVLSPFIVAALITYLLHPTVEKLHKSGIQRPLALFIIYLLFFGGVGYGLYKGIPLFLVQVMEVGDQLPLFVGTYKEWVSEVHYHTSSLPDGIHTKIEGAIDDTEKMLEGILNRIADSIRSAFSMFFLLILIPFIAFYMLKDFDKIKHFIFILTPAKWRDKGKSFLKDVDHSLGSYLRGQFLVCFIIGACATILLWIFHMPYPFFLGTIIGVTNIIPYFGPIIGAIPSAVIALTISVKMVIIVVIIIFVLQFLEGNVLSPLIVGKSLHIHPLLIMLALLLGGEIGGVLGLILAVPLLAILKVTITYMRSPSPSD
ncbi:AI-2E family transporter [Priestia filamentosa]|nr:AI-2E family transporter [Priestia filamentosa]MDT3764511.1 AI-2E family transporter [Priestia filamentosa]WCM15124.1 AI-2E family transporter [Priestia filamentosa]SMF03960.1 Predicted PurR-regulated permease PerM [Priestia filamentosa]